LCNKRDPLNKVFAVSLGLILIASAGLPGAYSGVLPCDPDIDPDCLPCDPIKDPDCIGPEPPFTDFEEWIDMILDDVKKLEDEKTKKDLTKDLEKIKKVLSGENKNKDEKACKQFEKFLQKLERLLKKGKIPQSLFDLTKGAFEEHCGCICSSFFVDPIIKSINSDIKKVGKFVKVKIETQWEGSILCAGIIGKCEGKFDLKANSQNWRVDKNFGDEDGVAGQVVAGSEKFTIKNKKDESIECEGDCTKKIKKNKRGALVSNQQKFWTVYEANIENTANPGVGNMGVEGTITLEIIPSTTNDCQFEDGWKIILKVDTPLGKTKGQIDSGESDWDGDNTPNENDGDRDGDEIPNDEDKFPDDPRRFK